MAVIPKEQSVGFQKLQFGSLNPAAASRLPETAPPAAPVESEVVTVSESDTPVEEIALPTAEDIERIHEEARQAGYTAGQEEARKENEEKIATAIEEALQPIREQLIEMQAALNSLEQSVAEELLAVGLEIGRQLTHRQIQHDPALLLPIIRDAVAALPLHHAHVTLQLHPDDLPLIRDGLGEQISQQGIQLQGNRDILRGGCRMTAGASEIDATLETRWKKILEAIGAPPTPWATDET